MAWLCFSIGVQLKFLLFWFVQVGKIYFDSKRECKDDCYVGLPTVTPGKTNTRNGLWLVMVKSVEMLFGFPAHVTLSYRLHKTAKCGCRMKICITLN